MSYLQFLFLSLMLFSPEGDWTQWRGTNRDGSVTARPVKMDWPQKLSLIWEKDVGEGYSGPIGNENRIWIHSRRGDEEIVSCLDLEDGRTVWTQNYPVPFVQDPDARDLGKGPYSTPVWADNQLFTLSMTNVLSVWNAESGQLLWRKDYSSEFKHRFPYFGAAASPLVWEGLCFVHFGGHKRGGPDLSGQGAMVALDVQDGREVWRWSEEAPAIGASPMIFQFGNRNHLVFKSIQKIVGLVPQSGKELWEIPYKVPMSNTIVTPTVCDELLMTSDYQMGIFAWKIETGDKGWRAVQIYKNHRASMFNSSPVMVSGCLVGFSHHRKGQLFGLDPVKGQILWRGQPRSGEHASLISWGNQVLVFPDDGSLIVGTVTQRRFQPIREYQLGKSANWSHPAVIGDRLIMRDATRLKVYSLAFR